MMMFTPIDLLWAAAKSRWPQLTERMFKIAVQSIIDRAPAEKSISIKAMSIQLEQALRQRMHDAES